MLKYQAEYHSQKQKKAWTAMAMTSGYPGKQSAEVVKKENTPQNHKNVKNEKE
jgi:hypothetical protein